MPLKIIREDLTKMKVDAIVNAANTTLLGGGGVDGAIHRVAGPALLAECKMLNGCEVGQAKMTSGYLLPAKHVIHTVGPIWHGGQQQEEQLLASCYQQSLALAYEHQLKSIAFPMISAGVYRFPRERVLAIATSVISQFLLQHEMMVYLVVYDQESFQLSGKRFAEVQQFITDRYVEEHAVYELRSYSERRESSLDFDLLASDTRNLEDVFKQMEETFSQMLLRLIDEKGKTDVETYKRANIDRRLFSKIRSDVDYQPSRVTVIAFAIALELNLDETKDLLLKAGFALSNSSKFDLIIQFYIQKGIYDIYEINEALFAFDQVLLG
jgi:O-acetyl-ADP-ribose deacetylase (regulator of RNase III)